MNDIVVDNTHAKIKKFCGNRFFAINIYDSF